MADIKVVQIQTSPIPGQKTGTSGLRKKVSEFQKENYVENWTQSLFNALKESDAGDFAGQTLVLGGDGRFYNDTALKKIIRLAAGYAACGPIDTARQPRRRAKCALLFSIWKLIGSVNGTILDCLCTLETDGVKLW